MAYSSIIPLATDWGVTLELYKLLEGKYDQKPRQRIIRGIKRKTKKEKTNKIEKVYILNKV